MKANVIVIDDDPDTLLLLTQVLSTRTRETFGADGGEEGIRLIEITPRPSLVLLDIRMPDLNGIEVFRRILDMRDDQIDVVLMTASMPSEYRDLTQAGVQILRKPLQINRVQELVLKRLEQLDHRAEPTWVT